MRHDRRFVHRTSRVVSIPERVPSQHSPTPDATVELARELSAALCFAVAAAQMYGLQHEATTRLLDRIQTLGRTEGGSSSLVLSVSKDGFEYDGTPVESAALSAKLYNEEVPFLRIALPLDAKSAEGLVSALIEHSVSDAPLTERIKAAAQPGVEARSVDYRPLHLDDTGTDSDSSPIADLSSALAKAAQADLASIPGIAARFEERAARLDAEDAAALRSSTEELTSSFRDTESLRAFMGAMSPVLREQLLTIPPRRTRQLLTNWHRRPSLCRFATCSLRSTRSMNTGAPPAKPL